MTLPTDKSPAHIRWLADGFIEGQQIRVTNAVVGSAFFGQSADFKIAIIRGNNKGHDEKIEFTAKGALPGWLTERST